MEEEFKYIQLDKIKVQKNNVRTQNFEQGIDDLASSIRANGLLQPIATYFDSGKGHYIILTGQRRFNAYNRLNDIYPDKGFDKIQCKIIDEPESDDKKKALSLAENITQLPMSNMDLVKAVTDLFDKYNDFEIVEKEFGLSKTMVNKYVKLARLPDEMKTAIREGRIHSNPKRSETVSLQAVDALEYTKNGTVPVTEAINMAIAIGKRELSSQDAKVEGKRGGSVKNMVERARTKGKLKETVAIDLSTEQAEKLQLVAQSKGEETRTQATKYVVDGLEEDYKQLGD